MGMWSWMTRRRREMDLDEADFKEEVRAHLAIAAEERVAEGDDPRNARYAALREFGNVTLTTEAARRVWTPSWLEHLRDITSDIRYACRALAKNPAFSLTVVGVLTLGIGLNAAVFTMLKGTFISPIAGVKNSSHIAVIFAETSTARQVRLSYPDYVFLRDHDRAFNGLFGTSSTRANLGRGRAARQVWAEIVTGNYFPILGVQAQLGRTLQPSDDVAPGRHPVVVLSDRAWRREFAADPAIVGRTIDINNQPMVVVGVTAPGFHGTTVVYDVDVYFTAMMAPQLGYTFGSQQTTPAGILADPRATFFYPQGFLRQGVTIKDAAAQTEALWATAVRDRSLSDVAERVRLVPFWKTPSGAPSIILPTLSVLSAMGLLVLAIACANIAGLVLVRGVSRRGEIALRLALGATRRRIVRLLIVENLVLAIPGAILGVLVAQQGIPVFTGYTDWLAAPDRLFFNMDVDRQVIVFAAIVACGCALVFGFVPALQSSRVDLVSVINTDASPRGAGRGCFRSALVVAQVAVSLLLLVGAGLVTRSLDAARRVNPGFDPSHVASTHFELKQNGYDEARGQRFYRQLLDDARHDSRIESAALGTNTPLAMLETRLQRVAIDGYEPRRGEDLAFMSNVVSSDYFRTLRIALTAGREFEDRDDAAAAPVVIVNQTLAHRFWGDAANAIGKRLRVADGQWRTVIGVAADVKYARIDEAPRPYFYLPLPQTYRSNVYLYTRGAAPVEQLTERARDLMARLDGDLPILSARPLADRIRGALIFMDLAATMLFLFGTAGMALAALGTYGLVSYTVKQSTREIAIRIALGATATMVVRQFVQRGLRLGTVGIVLGTLGAAAMSGFLGRVLFGVSALDGISFARALAIVLGGVVLATLIPAWRASRTNPLSTLRHQ